MPGQNMDFLASTSLGYSVAEEGLWVRLGVFMFCGAKLKNEANGVGGERKYFGPRNTGIALHKGTWATSTNTSKTAHFKNGAEKEFD